ncbi:MAG: cation:proton antiporter [Candidatus Andersenbacteria bacterium]
MTDHFQESLTFFLPQVALIILAAPLAAKAAVRLGQPKAVGWIAAGVLLGPSLFGKITPGLFGILFRPAEVGLTSPEVGEKLLTEILIHSEWGLILLLFQMGAQFNFSHLWPKRSGDSAPLFKRSLAISLVGIAAPFTLACLFARPLHNLVGANVPYGPFVLFLGISMSITALPILAHIMEELGIHRTRIGTATITSGSSDDAAAWIFLAAITNVVMANFNIWVFAPKLFLLFGVYFPAMIFVIRPLLRRWLVGALLRNKGKLSLEDLGLLLGCVLLSGWITHLLGIFAIFGAFLMGAMVSGTGRVRRELNRHLGLVTSLFLPVFFTSTGLRTDIGGLNNVNGYLLLAAVLVIAVGGKFACAFAAWAGKGGFSIRESLCIGTMMNCRALMELVALNIGRELGVVPPTLFTALVLMALITTAMTKPLLVWLAPGTELEPYLCKNAALPKAVPVQA